MENTGHFPYYHKATCIVPPSAMVSSKIYISMWKDGERVASHPYIDDSILAGDDLDFI